MNINLHFAIDQFVTLRFNAEWLNPEAADKSEGEFNVKIAKTGLTDLLVPGTRFLAILGEEQRIPCDIGQIKDNDGFLFLTCHYLNGSHEGLELVKPFVNIRN